MLSTKMLFFRRITPFLQSNSKCSKIVTTPRLMQGKTFHSSAVISKKYSYFDCGLPPPHPDGGYKTYKYFFWLAAFPTIVLLSLWNYKEHQNKQRCYKRPPFVKYSYLYKRTKRFPWGEGNKSLFHNKEKNALPDGYED